MIVAMKKISIMVQEKDAQSALSYLRSLGILHIEHQRQPQGANISTLQDDIALVSQAIGILSESEFSQRQNQDQEELQDWKTSAQHIIDMRKRYQQLKDYSLALQNMIAQCEAWGDFDPQAIKSLSGKNIYVRFYQISVKEIKGLAANVVIRKISVRGGMANCVVISREKIEVPYKEIHLPKMSLSRAQARLDKDLRVMRRIGEEIKQHRCYLESFLRRKNLLEKELEFHQAKAGMAEAGEIAYLSGFAPFDTEGLLLESARKEKWGIMIRDPSGEDQVPTLIRNPAWVSIIRPVFKLLEIIPGYRELDVSPLFLIFLSLFFGMIIGDAGYGATYFLLTFWLQKKLSRKIKDTRVFSLIYLFSACAIFWGFCTGTVFGQEWYLKLGLKPFVPILNDTKFLQAFCFFLGALHLTLAHSWQAARKLPSLTALADIGWILVLWAAFFLAKTLILNDPLPYFGKWLIMAGISLAVLFSNPQKNILKMLGQGLGTVALSLVNNFTDVVSYVRLFAVGLAGVAIADTVNTLAVGLGGVNSLVGGLVIFIGHTVNIVLGPMSVLVHGIRLNVLEFSSHAGLSWSGIGYHPLKE